MCLCLCVYINWVRVLPRKSPNTETHTHWLGSPLAPVFLGFLPVLRQQPPPSARHSEHPTMGTYVPTGRPRDAARAFLYTHTHANKNTYITAW